MDNFINNLHIHIQKIFDVFSSGIIIENDKRNIIYANDFFINKFNIDKSELLGKSYKDNANQIKYFFKYPEKFLNEVYSIPLIAQRREDIVETNSGLLFIRKYYPITENTKCLYHVWVYEDITALEKKKKELLTQKDLYCAILDEIPADIAIFSPDHSYLFVNKMGIKDPELRKWIIGKNDYDYCTYKCKPLTIAEIRREKFIQAKENKIPVSWIDESIKNDGTIDYILRIFYPHIDNYGEIDLMIGYGINITEQKKYEISLELQNKTIQSLLDTLNDGVFQMTYKAKIIFYNKSFIDIMNISDHEMSEYYNKVIMRNVHPEDKFQLYAAFEKLISNKELQKGVFRILDNNNKVKSYIDYHIWYNRTVNDEDCVTGRLTDITEYIKREQEMEYLVLKEKELNEMKSNFIHITSHELRTPLSVILSSAEILEKLENDKNQNHYENFISNIIREVHRMTETLNEILIVGRIETGNIKYNPELIDIRTFIDVIVKELYTPYKDSRNLIVDISPSVQLVNIDAILMRHALVNIIDNAFKYSASMTSPELKIFNEDDKVVFQISDKGIGIPKSDINRLFNPFFRASNVGNIQGTGIGLMVVNHVVKMHGGNIEIKSELGKGTTVIINLKKQQQL